MFFIHVNKFMLAKLGHNFEITYSIIMIAPNSLALMRRKERGEYGRI